MNIYALLTIIIIQISSSTEKIFRHKPKYQPYYYDNSITQPTCAKNEEYLNCGNEYGRHCRDILKVSAYDSSTNDLECGDGCFCIQEFYRKDVNGLCVKKDECYADKYHRGSVFYGPKLRLRRSYNQEISTENDGEDGERYYYRQTNRRFRNSVYEDRKRRLKMLIYLNEEKRRQYLLSQIRDYYQTGKKKKKTKQTVPNDNTQLQGTQSSYTGKKKKKKQIVPSDNNRLQGTQSSYAQTKYGHKYANRKRNVRNYQSYRRCVRLNEVFQRCGTDCGKTCNKIRENQYCDPNTVCRSGCFCMNGYVRDDFGACITRNKCTADYSKCGKNKKHMKCGNNCNMLCKDIMSPGHRVCDPKTCFEGCFCINGMFMNGKNQCVHPKYCT